MYGVENMLEAVLAVKDNYGGHLGPWVKWMEETGKGVDEEGIAAYFAYLNKSEYSSSSIRAKRSAIKYRVLYVLYNNDELYERAERFFSSLNRRNDTKPPKGSFGTVRKSNIFSHTKWEELQRACNSDRQLAFIRFLYITGCRASELCGARLDWCRAGVDSVSIAIIGKGMKERILKIPRELYDFIVKTFHGKRYLFETSTGSRYSRGYVYEQVKAIADRAGLKLTPNSFRHTFATRMMLAHPGKLDAISSYMGHTNPAMTVGT